MRRPSADCAANRAFVLLLLVSFLAPGCDRARRVAPSAPSLTVVDDLHRRVVLNAPPRRIVSLAPNLTEMLFALGAGDRVAGVTRFCDAPSEAARKPRVGDMLAPDLESILGLRADLVVMTVEGNRRETLRRLEGLGIPVFVSNPRGIDGVRVAMRRLGALLGCSARAHHVDDSTAAIRDSIRAHPPARRDQRLLMFVSVRPLMVAGPGSFIDSLIREAGGINAAAALHGAYPVLSREALLELDPDVIVLPDDMLGGDPEALYPEWRHLRAVRGKRVIRLNADLVLRPGPRVFRGLQLVHAALSPTPAR
jgi:iron complex transport system substrate-binding protein